MTHSSHDHTDHALRSVPAESRSPGGGGAPPPALDRAPKAPRERGFFMPATTMSDEQLLRPIEVAQLLGIGRSTVYEMLRTGELPSCRFGTSLRVPWGKLKRWIEAHSSDGETGQEKARPGAGRWS